MFRLILVFLFLIPQLCFAAQGYKTRYNPFTSRQDYVIDVSDIEAGDITATGTITGVVVNATTALQLGSDYITDITGSGLSIVGGQLTSAAASGDITSVGDCTTGACSGANITWGSGSGFTQTFDAGASDPVWTYSSGIANLSTGTLQAGGVAVLTAEVDGSTTNEINTITLPDANVTAGLGITFAQAGAIAITESVADTILFTVTEVDGSITNELPIAGYLIDISGSPASTVNVDLTEAESVTWGAGAAATIVHTYDVSGTDTTMTMGSAATTFSGGLTIQSGVVVQGTGNSTFTESVIITGDLTITGDDLFMTTNTSGAVLVADGTNFNPVVMSGDASISTLGAVTVADSSHAHSAATITEADPLALLTAGTDNVKDTHIDWGTGAGQVNPADFANQDIGDITITTGDWAVENDSHAHTTTSISGIDIGDDTNLAAGRSLTLSGDSVEADAETYTFTKCIFWENPVAADDFKSIGYARIAQTLTHIYAESDQTVTLNLQIDDGTPADVATADLAPAAGSQTACSSGCTTTIAAGAMAVGDRLDMKVTSVANTPTWVSVCFTGTFDD